MQEKTNKVGGLFKSIGSEEIAHMLSNKEGIPIPPEALQIKSPIKKSGEYTIELRAGASKGTLTLAVSEEEKEESPTQGRGSDRNVGAKPKKKKGGQKLIQR